MVFPLVDSGSLETMQQERDLIEGLLPFSEKLVSFRIKIVFESDYPPDRVASFISCFPSEAFGINYDIGNSAALGYSPSEEISCFGKYIDNVHVKDRLYQGTTVPLGHGSADLPAVFKCLRQSGYSGNFILQTARAADGDHAAAIDLYRQMTLKYWADSGT